MLAIRLKRIGRTGNAAYRLVVQDSHWSPKSGKVVAYLGSYNPHTRALVFDKDKTTEFVKNGAQPSPKVARLLKGEGQKLPAWVAEPLKKSGKVKNPDKHAKGRPASEKKPAEALAEAKPETAAGDTKSDNSTEISAETTEAAETPSPAAAEAPMAEKPSPAPDTEAQPEAAPAEPKSETRSPKPEAPATEASAKAEA